MPEFAQREARPRALAEQIRAKSIHWPADAARPGALSAHLREAHPAHLDYRLGVFTAVLGAPTHLRPAIFLRMISVS
jgi:hypothetical protein